MYSNKYNYLMQGKYYMLVNPYVEGSEAKIFEAENSLKAAGLAYESISKYFNNSVHNFKFSLLKLKTDAVKNRNDFNLEQYGGNTTGLNKRFNVENFSHFVASENISSNNQVDFSIKKYEGNVDNIQNLIQNIIKVQQTTANNKSNKSNKYNKSFRLSETPKSNNLSTNTTSSSSNSTSSSSDSESDSDSDSDSQHGGELKSQSEQNAGELKSISDQNGGKKKKSKYDDDDDDSSDSSDNSPDYYVKKIYVYDPISYWYYYPPLYTYDRLYLPTFPFSSPYVVDFTTSVVGSTTTTNVLPNTPTITINP